MSEEFRGRENVEIVRDGFAVSRAADYIIYSVEAAAIDSVIALYGPGMSLLAVESPWQPPVI